MNDIRLVPVELSHAQVFADATTFTGFTKYLSYEDREYTLEEAKKDIQRIEKRKSFMYSIDLDGKVIGRVGMSKRKLYWFLWYWIHPIYQRKGYGKKAVRKFLEFHCPDPLYAWVHKENEGSIEIMNTYKFQKKKKRKDMILFVHHD